MGNDQDDKTVKTDKGASADADGFSLSDDPFAEPPKKPAKIDAPVSEEEITIKEALKKRARREGEDETTVIHRASKSHAAQRVELPAEVSSKGKVGPVGPVGQVRRVRRPGALRLILITLLLALLGGGGYLAWQKYFKKPPVKPRLPAKERRKGKVIPVKLSPLTFFQTGKIVSPRTLKPGESVTARFFIDDWDPQAVTLNVAADVRIFSESGELVVYQPKYVAFSKKMDKNVRKVQIDTEVTLGKDIPAGMYRMMIELTDQATSRRSTLQAKIGVVR